MFVGRMSSFTVFLILAISAITVAYPAQNPFGQYVPWSDPYPYSNYEILVPPYPAPPAFTYEYPETGPIAIYNDFSPFVQPPFTMPQRSKTQTISYQEEVKEVIGDVLRLLINQRICEISKADDRAPVSKRSVNQLFPARSSPPETSAFTQQQLEFLKDLKLDDVKQLIKLLIPSIQALAANQTAPVQQELPYSAPSTFYAPSTYHAPSTFYPPSPVWYPTPLQMPELPPSPYVQNDVAPFYPFEQPIISYTFKPADESQFQVMKPYEESPAAPSFMMNQMPPVSRPLEYSLQISVPAHSNQAVAKPVVAVPNSQMISEPLPPQPNSGVTLSPQASLFFEKLESVFSQSTARPVAAAPSSQMVSEPLPPKPDLGVTLSPQACLFFEELKSLFSQSTARPVAAAPCSPMVETLPPKPNVGVTSSTHTYEVTEEPESISSQSAARPVASVPNSQTVSKPLPPKSNLGVTTSPPSSIIEKLKSLISQSETLQQETTTRGQVTSSEKSKVDLGSVPTNKVDNVLKISNSNKPKNDAAKAKSAKVDEFGAAQPVEIYLLEVFESIREDLMKNDACKTTPKRRSISKRPHIDFNRNQMFQDDLSRHAIPPANLPGKRHNPPTKIRFHKHAPHTPIRSTSR